LLIIIIKRINYYGFNGAINKKEFLYFIPLIIISLFNLRNGIHINNSSKEIIFYILTMVNIGFIEEILFRGFLFKIIEKDNLKTAIIVSSVTFGIGHIVNLLNGAELIPTILQVCYAISIGYMLVLVFYKSKSLIPCIIFHSVFNLLSIFNNGSSEIWSSILLIILCLGYALFINKKIPN
jgi:membrane protease YdiL (CAAX protease family)